MKKMLAVSIGTFCLVLGGLLIMAVHYNSDPRRHCRGVGI